MAAIEPRHTALFLADLAVFAVKLPRLAAVLIPGAILTFALHAATSCGT